MIQLIVLAIICYYVLKNQNQSSRRPTWSYMRTKAWWDAALERSQRDSCQGSPLAAPLTLCRAPWSPPAPHMPRQQTRWSFPQNSCAIWHQVNLPNWRARSVDSCGAQVKGLGTVHPVPWGLGLLSSMSQF